MSRIQIQHFILVFDRAAGRLVAEESFGSDSTGAVSRYSELEREYSHREEMDIVLVGSDSIDTVRVTHANYYNGTTTHSQYLAGLLVDLPS